MQDILISKEELEDFQNWTPTDEQAIEYWLLVGTEEEKAMLRLTYSEDMINKVQEKLGQDYQI